MTETLAVPEQHLLEVCQIIRAGIAARKRVTPEVRRNLLKWCKEEEEYMRQNGKDENE